MWQIIHILYRLSCSRWIFFYFVCEHTANVCDLREHGLKMSVALCFPSQFNETMSHLRKKMLQWYKKGRGVEKWKGSTGYHERNLMRGKNGGEQLCLMVSNPWLHKRKAYASKTSYEVEKYLILAVYNIPWGVLSVIAVFAESSWWNPELSTFNKGARPNHMSSLRRRCGTLQGSSNSLPAIYWTVSVTINSYL